ncbi:MAG: nifH element site-specific recombinase, partial [Cyanobacteriota bacterium]
MGLKPRVGYIRVSTAKGEQLSALENQRARVQATGVERILEDVQSGRETDRAGYLELLALIESRRISEVVITRVDRLGRDAADVDAAIAFAAKRGVKLTAIDGGVIESETPQGFVMSRIMTTMAEMESRMLSQRIKAGLREGRKRRLPLRGRAPWGYRINAQRTALEPDPVEWPRAEQFLALLQSSKWRMNTALDRWDAEGRGDIPLHSCRAVRAWLVNPILRGGLGYQQQANHTYA